MTLVETVLIFAALTGFVWVVLTIRGSSSIGFPLRVLLGISCLVVVMTITGANVTGHRVPPPSADLTNEDVD